MDRILLMGLDRDTYNWVLDHGERYIQKRSVIVEKREPHPQPDVADTIAALKDEDMRRKNASWIREVPASKVEQVLEDAETRGQRIWAYSYLVEGYWKDISRTIDGLSERDLVATVLLPSEADPRATPDMEYEPDPPKNPNAPFCYDPNYDYYTNP